MTIARFTSLEEGDWGGGMSGEGRGGVFFIFFLNKRSWRCKEKRGKRYPLLFLLVLQSLVSTVRKRHPRQHRLLCHLQGMCWPDPFPLPPTLVMCVCAADRPADHVLQVLRSPSTLMLRKRCTLVNNAVRCSSAIINLGIIGSISDSGDSFLRNGCQTLPSDLS